PRSPRFIFYSARRPSSLHSFPTRRSSDLGAEPPGIGPLRLSQPGPAHSWLALSGLPNRRRGWCSHDSLAPWNAALYRERAKASKDRKSTRLNSSHVSISYAVFCLKKKKNK